MLGLLGLRIFEATGADIADLGEEHGHRVLHVCGKGTKIVLLPLPPAVGRAIDQAIGGRTRGPILLNSRGARMDRHAATRRLRHLAGIAGVRITRPHPYMLRHTYVTTMLDAGADLRDVQIAAPAMQHGVRGLAGRSGCTRAIGCGGVQGPEVPSGAASRSGFVSARCPRRGTARPRWPECGRVH